MSEDFPVPDTRVLAIASHVGRTILNTTLPELTSSAQGRLRVSLMSHKLSPCIPPHKSTKP
ncbi:hypothetical protein OCU04_000263 [Sclerotinia nivalis]|uniref:Uncharacterized protein n=1 Tax=Sclerotinia nivalis TaxID=352851 RepID=A0A9X0AWC7_9HELO|nr:hypothetical protein OCU04_000263 [Sclerotinia nivalis]